MHHAVCVTRKVNFIKQLLKGSKTSRVFIACTQVIPALYNPVTNEILVCVNAGLLYPAYNVTYVSLSNTLVPIPSES